MQRWTSERFTRWLMGAKGGSEGMKGMKTGHKEQFVSRSRSIFSEIRSWSNFSKFWSRFNFSKFRYRSNFSEFRSRYDFSEFRSSVYLQTWPWTASEGLGQGLTPHPRASDRGFRLYQRASCFTFTLLSHPLHPALSPFTPYLYALPSYSSHPMSHLVETLTTWYSQYVQLRCPHHL